MSSAADAQRARDEAEQDAEALYQAAVAYVATQSSLSEGESDDDGNFALVVFAGSALALTLILSLSRRYGSDFDVDDVIDNTGDTATEYSEEFAQRAIKDSTAHLSTIATRAVKKDPTIARSEIREKFRNDKAWMSSAARTMTTEAAPQIALDMLPLIEEATGFRHELLWVSRGDHKVRSSHRKLHGGTRRFGKPFKRFPDGRTLRFPGDPLAPLNEVINCRCSLLLVPASEARNATDLFKVRDAEWEAIDSLRASVGWEENPVELALASADLAEEMARSPFT
jgi:hypothetical protein